MLGFRLSCIAHLIIARYPSYKRKQANLIPVVALCSSLSARIQLYQQHLPPIVSLLDFTLLAHRFCSPHPSRPLRPLHPQSPSLIASSCTYLYSLIRITSLCLHPINVISPHHGHTLRSHLHHTYNDTLPHDALKTPLSLAVMQWFCKRVGRAYILCIHRSALHSHLLPLVPHCSYVPYPPQVYICVDVSTCDPLSDLEH